MKFDIIIQARSGSSRLPNKIFLPLGNITILEFLIKNLKKIKLVNKIILAVPNKKKYSLFNSIAKRNKIYLFISNKNSENNVLQRFFDCAQKYQSEIIIRITPDCPFINIYLIEKMIKYFKRNKILFLTNNKPRNIPHGFDCEIFHNKLLNAAYKNAYKRYDLEHVTNWIYVNCVKKVNNLKIYKENFSEKRITIDYKEDYDFFLKNLKILKKISTTKKCQNLLRSI
tara:strand:+ start:260 stop:940 length:681 start_codon:yes stop_codon:yes gene_type:complete